MDSQADESENASARSAPRMHVGAGGSCSHGGRVWPTHLVVGELWADVVAELVIQLCVGHVWPTSGTGAESSASICYRHSLMHSTLGPRSESRCSSLRASVLSHKRKQRGDIRQRMHTDHQDGSISYPSAFHTWCTVPDTVPNRCHANERSLFPANLSPSHKWASGWRHMLRAAQVLSAAYAGSSLRVLSLAQRY